MIQPSLFSRDVADLEENDGQKPALKAVSEWGTFKDSLKAPVYRWFTYPAGFSYKAVEWSIRENNLDKTSLIYDPFMGTATTNLTAKLMGIPSIGVEAHPFVFDIARSKLNLEIDVEEFRLLAKDVLRRAKLNTIADKDMSYPELIYKCYDLETLRKLHSIKLSYRTIEDEAMRNLFKTALAGVLRMVSEAATGWPYIAPNKIKVTSINKDAYYEFEKWCEQIYLDIKSYSNKLNNSVSAKIYNADSRDTKNFIETNSVDHIFCSPPYLNNFDYSDRTRLELYFFDDAKNWGEISQNYRTRLMTSATTQVNKKDSRYVLNPDYFRDLPLVYDDLLSKIMAMNQMKYTKAGKKDYDLMTAGYFNDMYQIVSDNARVLKEGSTATYVLGDSAPYGVHVPTDIIIGEIGIKAGFSSYEIIELRKRGEKWKDNPQRHGVLLRESVLILRK